MTTQTRSAFLHVRALADLDRAIQQLTAYLEILRGHTTDPEQVMLGIWIDEAGATHPPAALTITDAQGAKRVLHIPEASGINGIWMVCWLDVAVGSVSRAELLAALRAGLGPGPNFQSTPRFIPVYGAGVPEASMRADIAALRALCPELLFLPIQFNRDGGFSCQQSDSPEGASS